MLDVLLAISRKLIVMGMVWLVAKGWITSDQARHDLPDVISTLILILTVGWGLGGEWLQRWFFGLTKNSPFLAKNLARLSISPKALNAQAAAATSGTPPSPSAPSIDTTSLIAPRIDHQN